MGRDSTSLPVNDQGALIGAKSSSEVYGESCEVVKMKGVGWDKKFE